MHICFATIDRHTHESGGGIASYVRSLAASLIDQGHEVSIIARGTNASLDTDENGALIDITTFGNLHWYIYRTRVMNFAALAIREIEWSVAMNKAVRQIHELRPIDLVEASEIGIQYVSGWENMGIATVIRLHGDPFVFKKYSGEEIDSGTKIARKLQLRASRDARALTAPSRYQAQELANELGWDANRVHVISNPISQQMMEAAGYHSREYLPDEAPVILYAGRIEYRKGILVLLNAVPEVLKKIPNAKIVVAGAKHNSIDEETLDLVLSSPHVRSSVHLLGHIPWQELIEKYRNATVFVMPSYYETFGISAIEAMAFGLPVVAARAGGLPEVVQDGKTGLLVPAGDPAALAKALIELLSDAALRQRLGENGRDRVSRLYQPDTIATQTIALYEQVIDEHA